MYRRSRLIPFFKIMRHKQAKRGGIVMWQFQHLEAVPYHICSLLSFPLRIDNVTKEQFEVIFLPQPTGICRCVAASGNSDHHVQGSHSCRQGNRRDKSRGNRQDKSLFCQAWESILFPCPPRAGEGGEDREPETPQGQGPGRFCMAKRHGVHHG